MCQIIAGDGTTTATVLSRAIFNEGLELVAAGHDPMSIKRGIDKAVEKVVAELKLRSKPTRDRGEIAQVGNNFRKQRQDHWPDPR